MSILSDLQSTAIREVDRMIPEMSEFHLLIWGFAESAWREYESAAAYLERLREEGFEFEAALWGNTYCLSCSMG